MLPKDVLLLFYREKMEESKIRQTQVRKLSVHVFMKVEDFFPRDNGKHNMSLRQLYNFIPLVIRTQSPWKKGEG